MAHFLRKLIFGQEPWSSGYGDNSYLKGCVFESRHRILDGQLDIFSHGFVVKIVLSVWKDQK